MGIRASRRVIMLVLTGVLSPLVQAQSSQPSRSILGGRELLQRFAVEGWYEMCSLPSSAGPRWILARRHGEMGWIVLVENVTGFAHRGGLLWGSTTEQYFVVTTSEDGTEPREIRLFSNRDEWQAVLEPRVGDVSDLMNPSSVAAALPRTSLRPWDYRFLGGVAGATDEQWANVFLVATLVVGAILGATAIKRDVVLAACGLLGAFTGWLSDSLVFEGPALGIVSWPLLTMGVAAVTRACRRSLVRAKKEEGVSPGSPPIVK